MSHKSSPTFRRRQRALTERVGAGHTPTMRPSILFLFACLGCGQIASSPSGQDVAQRNPAASSPTASPTASAVPPEPGACGVITSARSFATADEQAGALHGLWIGCPTDPAPTLCPASDASMFFGTLDANPSSRAAACGHLTTHGDGFVRNPAYEFTYSVENIAPSSAPPSYVLHVRSEATDRTFALAYRDDSFTGSVSERTMTWSEPDGRSGTLRHSEFSTY